MIPPHGCWQCKALFDDLAVEKRLELYTAMRRAHRAKKKMRKAGQRYVDQLLAKVHRGHQPESWI